MNNTLARKKLFFTEPQHVCRAYSEGRIGWRTAASVLAVEDYSEFIAKLHESGYQRPQPNETESRRKMEWLESLLYNEEEI